VTPTPCEGLGHLGTRPDAWLSRPREDFQTTWLGLWVDKCLEVGDGSEGKGTTSNWIYSQQLESEINTHTYLLLSV
jgi:hypothetical protein